jgi:vanillate O-demethylase monooxygenase subunit
MSNDAQPGTLNPNYPKNCWWVAARQSEVGREPLSRWLLDLPVVLYRTEAGEVVALDNRCIHRWAQISTGYLEGDNIVCGYHGAVYSPTGRCIRYPTQSKVPDIAKVRSYPVIERTPFVWIWMGDPEAVKDAPTPPEFPWFNNPQWLVADGFLPLSANYFLLHENVLDLTHFNYAHRKTFQVTDMPAPQYTRKGNEVSFLLVQEPFDIPAWQRPGLNLDHTHRREMLATFVTPALHVVTMPMTDVQAGPQEQSRFESWVVHCVTPESPTKTHYWWLYSQNFGNVPGAREALRQGIHTAFLEDKAILEGIQDMVLRDARGLDAQEVTFNGDAGGVQIRRVLQQLLNKEKGDLPQRPRHEHTTAFR